MTSFWRLRCFKKKPIEKNNKKVFSLKDYDDMYAIPKKVMTAVTIQMTHDLTDFQSTCWNIFFWFEVLNILLAIPAEFLTVVITAMHADGFDDAIKVFTLTPCVGTCSLSVVKCLKIKNNRSRFEALYYELRDMWPCGELSDDQHAIVSAMVKQVHFISKGYYWCNNILLVSYLTPSSYICIRRLLGYDTRMIFCVHYWLPFDPFKPYLFETILALQLWHSVLVIYWNVISDVLFCTYLAHITMQFELLSLRVRKFINVPIDKNLMHSYPLAEISRQFVQREKDAVNSYTDRDWELRHQKELVDIVARHHALIRLAGEVEEMFSFALLVNFINSSFIICFSAFCCVLIEKWNEMAYKTFLLTSLSQTWLLCWYGQQLLDSSRKVALALYESGWYVSSKKIKNSILIMMQRAQKGIHVTTYGFSIISLESFSTILKTSWSYFTLLINVYTRKND